MSGSDGTKTIKLPNGIITKIDNRVKHTEFEDANAYIAHLLEEVLYQVEQQTDFSNGETVDEQQVRDRLKSLGYLNE